MNFFERLQNTKFFKQTTLIKIFEYLSESIIRLAILKEIIKGKRSFLMKILKEYIFLSLYASFFHLTYYTKKTVCHVTN